MKFRAFMTVSRKEYMPSAINEVGIPAILALSYVPISIDFFLLVLLGLLVWWLGHFIGSHINCLSDYEVDKKYKSYLPEAVDAIGKGTLKKIMIVEIALTTLIVILSSVFLKRPLLTVFWVVGLLFAIAYSVAPPRFKGRGLFNVMTLDIVLYLCPMFFVYHLLCEVFYLFPTLIISIFALQMVPMFFVDEVSDYEEDKEIRINTPCVLYGRFAVTTTAIIIYIISSIAMIISFLVFHPPQNPFLYIGYAFSVFWFVYTIVDFYRLARSSRRFEKEDDNLVKIQIAGNIKRQVKTPLWLMSTGISVICLGFMALI